MKKYLREKRLLLGLTQAQVASKANITQKCYSYIETGERCGSLPVLKRIAKVLDISDINCF